jgi:[protein-PII] uridylyltransferase
MRPINDRFLDRGGMLEVAHDDLYERQPARHPATFLVYQQTPGHQGCQRAHAARAVQRAQPDGRELPARAGNRALFLELLQQTRGITHVLRRMNQWSVLGRYLPAFRRIVGRMQHDLFHVYTVDQHILMVRAQLRRFAMDEHAHEYPFCSQLMASFDRPWRLYIAALFHDIAKGRGGDHSVLGKRRRRALLPRPRPGARDTALIEFLVEHHLTMSSVAQKQDLTDSEVIARFAQMVGTQERLTALYLLTVADIRGTSPKVWNAWKGKLLQDLYRRPNARSAAKRRNPA